MNSKIYNIFQNNVWIKRVFFLILLQQILVASGTYLLGRLSSDYPTKGFELPLAILLFFCIILPGTIVHYWITWTSVRAGKKAKLNYITQYIDANYNHPTHWKDEKSKHQRHSIMCRGGQDAIDSGVVFFVDVLATSFNVIFNIVSIVLITDIVLGGIILVAGFLGIGIVQYYEKEIFKNSRNEMLADNKLNAHLSQSWDNIILGNPSFFSRWEKLFHDYFIVAENAALASVKKKDWAVSIGGLVTNGIVLGGALALAWTYQNLPGFVLGILVMLPRCLQTVMHIQIVQTYIAQWKSLREKLVVTKESILSPEQIDLSPYIQQDEISIISNNEKLPLKDFKNILESGKPGRFTITGHNGVGKSSFLLQLKNAFSSSAIYLPAQHQLTLSKSQLSLSSGEIALAALEDLKTERYPILLLDEWDGNLSPQNRASLNQVINQLSKDRIVVEVRHH